jgi:hypothetical protein
MNNDNDPNYGSLFGYPPPDALTSRAPWEFNMLSNTGDPRLDEAFDNVRA